MKSTNIKKYLRRLQKMTIDKNISDIKEYLNSLNKRVKGTIWEYYIRELYDGNGVVARVVGGGNDGGVDVVLFENSLQQTVSTCIQAKNQKQRIGKSNVIAQIANFKESGQHMYTCSKIIIISLNGFTYEAKKMESEDVKLLSWDYIEQLILSYDASKKIVSINDTYIYDDYFNMMVIQLIKFKERFGHCKVPLEEFGKYVRLAKWVSQVRMDRRRNELEDDKIKLLDSIGFCWDVLKEGWYNMFFKLKRYYEKYGCTKIRNLQDPVLLQWVKRQIDKFLHNQLEEYQIYKLESIGVFNDWL